MSLTRPDTRAPSKTLTAGDVFPTLAVVAVTVAASAVHYPLISVPGAVLSLVMIAVTLHPRHTLRSLARRPR